MFSEKETKIIKILGRKKLPIRVIAEEYFKGAKKPMDPGNVVSSTVNRINKKCVFHHLDWYIEGEGLGRGGKVVWKVKR